jgi:hypothetical protein
VEEKKLTASEVLASLKRPGFVRGTLVAYQNEVINSPVLREFGLLAIIILFCVTMAAAFH